MGDRPAILFDGVCNLCNRSVRYIIRHDPGGRFRMASLQSEVGRGLQREHGLDPEAMNSLVLVERGKVYTKSDAALRIARRLRGPVRFAWPLRFVPRVVRNAMYDWIARNRYKWFGKRDECMVPGASVRNRFLDADETIASGRG